jgi:hypothetical protein
LHVHLFKVTTKFKQIYKQLLAKRSYLEGFINQLNYQKIDNKL